VPGRENPLRLKPANPGAAARAAKFVAAGRKERLVSPFEFWPPVLFYIPVGFYYLWLALRFRGLTLPTTANPSIHAGGMIGESKAQIFSLMPDRFRHLIAPYSLFRWPQGVDTTTDALSAARQAMERTGLSYPIVAKPDVGQRGDGVRPVRNDEQLRDYLERFPKNAEILLQELVTHPEEAGVMYFRRPGEDRGTIFSLTLKEFPAVVGDGERTLRELILADRRARRIRKVYFRRHEAELNRVIDAGRRFPLVFSGNHCQGAIFKDGIHLSTPAMLDAFDRIAVSMPGFFFGRFDIRFRDPDALRAGKDFKIIEINGAGAEATHIWDARTTLSEAYGTLFRQFRALFEIGYENRRLGHRPMGTLRFLKDFFSYTMLARRYPMCG